MITTKNERFFLCITRFNNATFHENSRFRENKGISGCIYGSPNEFPSVIPRDGKVFVFELNNEVNEIMGIGFLYNRHDHRPLKIYNNCDYNRYCYKGKFRVDRSDLKEKDIEFLSNIEKCVFKGSTHQKRGHGFNRISEKNIIKLYENENIKPLVVLKWLRDIFVNYSQQSSINSI